MKKSRDTAAADRVSAAGKKKRKVLVKKKKKKGKVKAKGGTKIVKGNVIYETFRHTLFWDPLLNHALASLYPDDPLLAPARAPFTREISLAQPLQQSQRLTHSGAAYSLTFFGEAPGLLATCCTTGCVKLWDARTWTQVQEFRDPGVVESPFIEEFYVVQFSADTRTLFAAGKNKHRLRYVEEEDDFEVADCPIKVFDVASGALLNTLWGHTEEVLDLVRVENRGERYLLSCSQDGLICKWGPFSEDWRSCPGYRVIDPLTSCMVFSLSLVPDCGNKYFVAACDSGVKVYDFEHEQLIASFPDLYSSYCDCVRVITPVQFPAMPREVLILTRGCEDVDDEGVPMKPSVVQLHSLRFELPPELEKKNGPVFAGEENQTPPVSALALDNGKKKEQQQQQQQQRRRRQEEGEEEEDEEEEAKEAKEEKEEKEEKVEEKEEKEEEKEEKKMIIEKEVNFESLPTQSSSSSSSSLSSASTATTASADSDSFLRRLQTAPSEISLLKCETLATYSHPDFDANIWPLRIASDGKYVFSPTSNGRTFIWNIASGECVGTVGAAQEAAVRDVCLYPGQNCLLTASESGDVVVWEGVPGRAGGGAGGRAGGVEGMDGEEEVEDEEKKQEDEPTSKRLKVGEAEGAGEEGQQVVASRRVQRPIHDYDVAFTSEGLALREELRRGWAELEARQQRLNELESALQKQKEELDDEVKSVARARERLERQLKKN